MEAILLNSTWKLLWFEIASVLIAVKKINLLGHQRLRGQVSVCHITVHSATGSCQNFPRCHVAGACSLSRWSQVRKLSKRWSSSQGDL